MNRDFLTSNTFKTLAYKGLIYGSVLFVLVVAQCTLFARLSVFGATPDLALCALIAVSMKEGERFGAVFAIGAGFFSCALGGSVTYLYILFSFACSYAVTITSSKMLSNNCPSFIAFVASAMCAKGLFDLIVGALGAEGSYFLNILLHATLPELFCTLLFCVPVYFLFSALGKPFAKKHLHKGEFK